MYTVESIARPHRNGERRRAPTASISKESPAISGVVFIFFFNDTATTEIYTLSLHDALPIWCRTRSPCSRRRARPEFLSSTPDRKSTRLNSSHITISYAVFCLKKKKQKK